MVIHKPPNLNVGKYIDWIAIAVQMGGKTVTFWMPDSLKRKSSSIAKKK
jgi:hypothetical protein